MDDFKGELESFIWERISPALVKDRKQKDLQNKVECSCKMDADQYDALMDYSGATAEVSYKAGMRDGIKLAMELGVCANE